MRLWAEGSAELWLLRLMVAMAVVLLILGATLPLMTLEQFYIFESQVSLLGGLKQMADNGDWLLLLLVSAFSLIFPVVKLLLLFNVLLHGNVSKNVHPWLLRIHHIGKWSMLDVFVVAVLLVAVKFGALAQVHIHAGLYAFAGAILLTMLVTNRVVGVASRPMDSENAPA